MEIEKSKIFLRSKSLGIDLTWNKEKPWATKDIFINYVLIRNDSFETIITQFNSVLFTST